MSLHTGTQKLTDQPASPASQASPLRLVVSAVFAVDGQTRFKGHVLAGAPDPGQRVTILPYVQHAVLSDLAHSAQDATIEAALSPAVTLLPGDVICGPGQLPETGTQLAADIRWTGAEPMLPGRMYELDCAGQVVPFAVSALKYKHGADPGQHEAARQLVNGEEGYCTVSTSKPVVFGLGGKETGFNTFTILDRSNGGTAGTGRIRFALHRSENVRWQVLSINKAARGAAKAQRPMCLWFTGLSGSGKSTLANLLEKRLHSLGRHCYILDGDNVRHGLNRDLGFTDADRVENIRRVAEVAKLMVDAGLIVIVSFISPFRAERDMARALFDPGEFLEVFVDTPIEECEKRDPKGLYKKARAGLIKNFTGFDSAYEAPANPDLRLSTVGPDPDELIDRMISNL